MTVNASTPAERPALPPATLEAVRRAVYAHMTATTALVSRHRELVARTAGKRGAVEWARAHLDAIQLESEAAALTPPADLATAHANLLHAFGETVDAFAAIEGAGGMCDDAREHMRASLASLSRGTFATTRVVLAHLEAELAPP